MNRSTTHWPVIVLCLLAVIALSAGPVRVAGQEPPVTLDLPGDAETETIDPQIATVEFQVIRDLFLGLTLLDSGTRSQISPALASSWEVSDDGLTWTFHLRDDVLWWRYDPATGTAEVLRPVVAADVVYGIQRACDPRLGGFYGSIIATVIAGCDVVYGTPAEDATDELVFGETIRVHAPDDTTVIIELQFPAAYFLSMTTLPAMFPVPQEAIQEHGVDWTLPGNIITNGAFFFTEYKPNVRRIYTRNPDLPPDLYGGDGNIEVVRYVEVPDALFAYYQNNEIDWSNVPSAEMDALRNDPAYQDQLTQLFNPGTAYFGFSYDKPPFDNVHVRRAFSAIIDRQLFIDQLEDGLGFPMIHFTPPGILYAPPINDIGVGFDPAYAADQLLLAGYPNCAGFPEITVTSFTPTWGGFLASAAEQYLGCDPALFHVNVVDALELFRVTEAATPTAERPEVWALGWWADYNDAHNFIGDMLYCGIANNFKRPCTAIDDLIEQAAREPDPARRTELYAQIEEAFFGRVGEYPLAPLFLTTNLFLVKPWYTGPHQTGGLWTEYSIDMDAKLAARGE